MPVKIASPINLIIKMTSKFFNWECTLPFNTAPRRKEKKFAKFLDYVVNTSPKIIRKEYRTECIQNEFPLNSLLEFPSFYHGEKMWKILFSELVHGAAV
jgi:hypothetical protein